MEALRHLLFRLLLMLYPPAHRRRYGPEMEEVFERAWVAAKQEGRRAQVALAARAVMDPLRNAPALWARHLIRTPTGGGTMRERAEGWWMETRQAVRGLVRHPGFTLAALATLGVGLGANAALFSILHPVLLAPLPFEAGDRVVVVENVPRPGVRFVAISDPYFGALERGPHPFEAVAAVAPAAVNLGGEDRPERVDALRVTGAFFDAVRVSPLVGRTLTREDDRPGADDAVVISEGLWRRRFGGDPDVVGRGVRLGNRQRTVVGVVPADFRFLRDADVWLPLALDPARLDDPSAAVNNNRVGVALLPEGTTVEEAEAELAAVSAEIRRRFATDDARARLGVRLYRDWDVSGVRGGLWTLAAAVGLVLLVACANLANLVLVRNEARRGEMAVRAALGATRGRLLRRLVVENAVVGVAAAAVGLAVGTLGLRAVRPVLPAELGVQPGLWPDGPVLLFTLALGGLTGLVLGLLPVLSVGRGSLRPEMGSRGGAHARRLGVRRLLVAGQVAVAAALLVSAGLLVRSLGALGRVDPGFETVDRWAISLQLPEGRYGSDDAVATFGRSLTDGVAGLPGVEDAAVGQWIPLAGSVNWGFTVEGQPDAGVRFADYNLVGPGWFETLGIPVLQGRDFRWDDVGGEPVVVVSEALAERVWPGEDPVGRRLNVDVDVPLWRRVVGVVGNVRNQALGEPGGELLYLPPVELSFASPLHLALVVASPGGPPPVAGLRGVLSSLDPALPIAGLDSLDGIAGRSEARRRFLMTLLSAFAGITLVLASLGLYAVVSWEVALRARELGLRMALGARPGAVRAMVLRQGLLVVGVGLAVGLGAAAVGGRTLAGLVYEVAPTDPATFAAVGLLLGAVALAATVLPAARATRVDPVRALRGE